MRSYFLALLQALLLATIAPPSLRAQIPPADFKFLANFGGVAPWEEKTSVAVDNTGHVRCIGFASDDDPTVLADSSYTLSASALQNLWQKIQDSSFFSLDPSWKDSTFSDGVFLRITVTSNGVSHAVTLKNIMQPALQQIIGTYNAGVPAYFQIQYAPPQQMDLTPRDPCSSTGALGGATDIDALRRNSKDPKVRAFPGPYLSTISRVPPVDPSHPGTVVGCQVSLQDAVANGWAALSSKGDFFGDDVSITINNQNHPPCDQINITLYLEFFGPNATQENIDKVCADISERWSGLKTSSGKTIHINFNNRVVPGAASPPNTPGFHEIELVPKGSVRSTVEGSQGVNSGTGYGKWALDAFPGTYAHEVGHLLGLPDRYTDYNKMPDGSWVNSETGKSYPNDGALADYLVVKFPNVSRSTFMERLQNANVFHVANDGSENDLMGNLRRGVTQSDIDQITANAGLLVVVPQGLIFASRNGDEQNLIVIHKDDIYVGPGQSRTLNGIYAACVDHARKIPSLGRVFDVAPPISQWSGIRAAGYMARLLGFLDSAGMYCRQNLEAQEAIWRISDNIPASDWGPGVSALLANAGINLGDEMLDFPRLGGSRSTDSTSRIIVPTQLYVPSVVPGFAAGEVGVPTAFTARVSMPFGALPPTAYSWNATDPGGTVVPMSGTDSVASLTPARSGVYEVALRFTVKNPAMPETTIASDRKGYLIVPDENTETFEHAGLTDKYPWMNLGDVPWKISNNNPETGAYAAQPGAITSDQISVLGIEVSVPADTVIVFSIRASTSGFAEAVEFAIDNIQADWFTGSIDWKVCKYVLPAGRHLLTWSFLTTSSTPVNPAWLDNIFFPGNVVVTSVKEPKAGLPTAFALEQNFPNPFNPKTVVRSQTPEASEVRIVIYDVLGREVAVLVNERRAPGRYQDTFDGSGLASGMYLLRMTAGSFTQTRRLCLIK